MRILVGIILVFQSHMTIAQVASQMTAPTQKRNKIEELFIWKISDELKLSVSEDKKFAETFRKLGQKKSEIAHSQDELISKLSGAPEKDRKSMLSKYRQTLDDYNKIQIQEYDEFKKIFGEEKLAKYLQVKRELTTKVKNLLTERSDKKDSDLPPPKVIEE